MNRTKKLKLFLDASVLIAGSESPRGGSGIVIKACEMGTFLAVATRLVLIEAERNIAEKLSQETLLRFYQNIAQMRVRIQLLMLDRRHFQTRRMEKAGLNIQILTPGQFLEKHILG